MTADEHRVDDQPGRAQLVLTQELEQYPVVVSSRAQVAPQRWIDDPEVGSHGLTPFVNESIHDYIDKLLNCNS